MFRYCALTISVLSKTSLLPKNLFQFFIMGFQGDGSYLYRPPHPNKEFHMGGNVRVFEPLPIIATHPMRAGLLASLVDVLTAHPRFPSSGHTLWLRWPLKEVHVTRLQRPL
jgi:hypothetical protein